MGAEESERKGWDGAKKVTRAYDEWRLTDAEIRAFLDLTTRWMTERYKLAEKKVEESPGCEDGPDLSDLFDREVGGLWQLDYDWMLHAAVVRDAVTAFEVYLEKAGNEILLSHQRAWSVRPGRTPDWFDMVEMYSWFDVSIGTDKVRHIRNLRHALTHRRGELRTSSQREQFGEKEDSVFASNRAELNIDLVVNILDELGKSVRQVDQIAWRYSWGGARLTELPE